MKHIVRGLLDGEVRKINNYCTVAQSHLLLWEELLLERYPKAYNTFHFQKCRKEKIRIKKAPKRLNLIQIPRPNIFASDAGVETYWQSLRENEILSNFRAA